MPLLESDPVCFARDANGDLAFPLRLVAGLEAVAIGADTRARLFAGEWFLNLGVGIRYLPTEDGVVAERDALLGQKFDPVKAREEFRRELMTTPGVIDVPVLAVAFDAPTRSVSITRQLRTRFGDTPLDTLAVEV